MRFSSKKDLWLWAIIWGTIIICFLPLFFEPLVAIFLTLPTAVFLIWLGFSTNYSITDKEILIKSGPIRKSICIKDIKTISSVKNPLSAPALSLDRLEIIYGDQFNIALVSPEDKQTFIACLMTINTNIELDDKLSSYSPNEPS